jgi:hypothetical protein
MRKSVVTVLSLALACAGLSLIPGCETSEQQADHAAQKAVEAAEMERAGAGGLDRLDQIQNTYDKLAVDTTLSPQMQVLMRARQAQLRMERINMRVALLRSEEVDIERKIQDIAQLSLQVAGIQANIEALKQYDPAAAIDQLTAQKTAIQGSADSPQSGTGSPTLFAVLKEIETLGGQMQQNQLDSDTARKTSVAKGEEAEVYARRAEGETGGQAVADTTRSADDRRDAAIADSRSDILKIQLTRLQSSMDQAKQQQASLQNSIQSLDAQIGALQARWTTISGQIQEQIKNERDLVLGNPQTANSIGLVGLAQGLFAQMGDAETQRSFVTTELAEVIPQLQTVMNKCTALRTEWRTDIQDKQDDPDVVVWKQAMETLHPAYFNLQMASALQVKASVAAAKTRIEKRIIDMFDGYPISRSEAAASFKNLNIPMESNAIMVPGITALLDPARTGLDAKDLTVFKDIHQTDPDTFKQDVDEVNADYDAAVQAFSNQQSGATDAGPAASERKNTALIDLAAVNREWANFAQSIGDSAGADTHRQAASDAQSQIDPEFGQLVSSTPAAGAATASPPAQ